MYKRLVFTAWLVWGFVVACAPQKSMDLKYFYEYDRDLPLHAQFSSLNSHRFHVRYTSYNGKQVPALLSVPQVAEPPHPLIIMLHGIGDHKDADYMRIGDSIFVKHGFAVLRIDIEYHGERRFPGVSIKEARKFRYFLRNAMIQTVFDLRRAVDLADSLDYLDRNRTAFLGISLGGIIGAVFSGVENRVEFPILALAGGGLRWAYGKDGLSPEIQNMLAPVEPLNFVHLISPRPVLFQNAEKDEVIPRSATMLLYRAAKEPKQIIWYPAGHHMPPVPAFLDAVNYLKKQFAKLPQHQIPAGR